VATETSDVEGQELPRDVRIRPLAPADFLALCRYDWEPLIAERDTIYLFITQDHARYCFAAEDSRGRVVGYVVAARSGSGEAVFIFHVHVRDKHRRCGIGGALVRALEDVARSGGAEVIWLLASGRAKDFYSRLGYGPMDELLHPEAQSYVAHAKCSGVMGKRLDANDTVKPQMNTDEHR
jgi:predicted N-acetyltransferase YhbS